MPVFSYKVQSKNGKIRTYKIEKQTKAQVLDYLASHGEVPLEVKKVHVLNMDLTEFAMFSPKISKRELAFFCRQLSLLLKAGLTILDSLKMISEKWKSDSFKAVLDKMIEDISSGKSLSYCVANEKSFPEMLASMVEVGERIGDLGFTFERMSDFYEKENKNSSEIKNALLYPGLVFVSMILLLIVCMVYVVPRFAQIFMENELLLPLSTRLLLRVSSFISANYHLIIILLALFSIAVSVFFQTAAGKRVKDYTSLNFPAIKHIYRKMLNIKFSHTMGILLMAGIPLLQALEIAKNAVNSPVAEPFFNNIITETEKGESLSGLLEEVNYFENILTLMVSVGEQTGDISGVLLRCSDYLEDELSRIIRTINKLIEPVIMVILGLLLLFIMLAVMLPTFSLSNML